MSEPKSIASICITNVKGIEHLEFKAGRINVLSGRNGSGKSSVLDAIQSIFDGGHDSGLIRHGAERAEIELTLSDGAVILKTVTPKTSTLTVTTADGGVVKAPKAYVESLAVSFGYDPFALVDAKPAERMKWILDHAAIEFLGAELNKALGIVRYGEHERVTLERLNQIAEGTRNKRTDVNRQVRDREGMLRRQREAIAEDDSQDWSAKLAELQAEEVAARENLATAEGDVAAQVERIISSKKLAAEKEIQVIRERLAHEIENVNREAKMTLETGTLEMRQLIEHLAGKAAEAREKMFQQQRNRGARENLAAIEAELTGSRDEAEDLTRQLDAIEALKKAKLSEIPIPGLDIRDGEIYVDGVHWSHVNTSQQDIVAIQLGAYGLRELPLMILEQSEHIDDRRWQEICEAAREVGIQIFAERVNAKENLTVSADDAEFALAASGKLFRDPPATHQDPGDARRKGGRRR